MTDLSGPHNPAPWESYGYRGGNGKISKQGWTLDLGYFSVFLMALCVIALPKAGLPLGGGVPLYASVIVGEVIALLGTVLCFRYYRQLHPSIFLTLIFVTLFIWLMHVLIVLSDGASARRVARLVFNFLPFTALGIAMYVAYKPRLTKRILHSTTWAYYFLLFYALLQMTLGTETVAIQFITANYDESIEEVIRKTNVIHRLEGRGHKLFGTYQNGNLFSIGLVMLAPIALYFEKRLWVSLAAFGFLHVIIVFSASTTSYLSLIILDVLIISLLPRVRFYLPMIMLLMSFVGFIVYRVKCSVGGCRALDLLQAKLFERDLTQNARWDKTSVWIESLREDPWILLVGEMSTAQAIIFEVLPLSIIQFYGILVLLLFYVFLLLCLNPLKIRLYKFGLFAYVITSFGSAGFWLTPTPYLLGWVLGICLALDRYDHSYVSSALLGGKNHSRQIPNESAENVQT